MKAASSRDKQKREQDRICYRLVTVSRVLSLYLRFCFL